MRQKARLTAVVSLLLLAILLSACGSTSKLKPTQGKRSIADYSVIYVADFADKSPSRLKGAKLETYRLSMKEAGSQFADMIATNLEKSSNPPSVVRAQPTDAPQIALRIEGDITQFKRGNALAKMLLPLAGSTKFNADVRFVDSATGELLAEITVDKNSNPLGGGYAATQTTNAFMRGASEKIAEQVEKARNPKANGK